MKIELNKAIAGDALEALKALEPSSVDLAILDPNYDDWERLVAAGVLEDVYRAMKPTGNIICFTKQPFDLPLRIAADTHFRREFIWSFLNGGAWVSPKMPLVSFQKLYWLVVGKDFYFNPRTNLSYGENTKATKRSRKVFGDYDEEGKDFVPSEDGTWMRDHYHFNKPVNARVFAKPQELIRILVQCFSPAGGLVLDPFFGSGVTGEVCNNIGRDFIGVEIDEIAVADFNAEMASRLF
jgi:site-specific DNA-methyltransferase (adenine-specific)